MYFPQTMEETPLAAERRNFKRIRFDQPVQFQFKDPSCWGGCLSRDISEGGIRVNSSGFVPLHTELILRIQLAAERVVEGVAHVVWVAKLPWMDRYRLGLEFEPSDSLWEFRKEISRVIQS
jgi:c-di-GMP-binding flagellar brake protein YcgR